MKKILFILILILLNTANSVCAEEVELTFDENFQKQTLNIRTSFNDNKIAINETDIENVTPAHPL